jgi:tetratricopeptide (TPR) repeat protein
MSKFDNLTTRRILLAIILVFEGAAKCLGGDGPLANQNKDGIYVRSLEQVLRLKPDEVDLATAVLIVSERWNENVLGRRYVSMIDDMAYEIRERLRIAKVRANYRAIPIINKYLFEEQGFEPVKEASKPEELFLHSVLDSRRGYCLSLSILYLSLAERLGIPLYGVVVPGHFFVRYDDGRVRFNIETTNKGGSAPDEYYIEKFAVPQVRGGIYMRNLDKMQTLGCFFNNLGNSYVDVGNLEQAQIALERAVEINPSLAESRTNLGNVYLKKGRIEDAMSQYEAALQINPADSKTHNNLGNAYARSGKLDEAIREYNQSLELDPNFVDVYANLSAAYYGKKMFAKAETILKEAIELKPSNSSFYNQLGNVYSEMDQCEKAIVQYNKALSIAPNLADAYYGMGVCYNKLGLGDNEIWAYKRTLSIKPDMLAALANLGNAYFTKGDYGGAVEQYKKAVQIKPNDATIHYNLGAAYSNKGDYEAAVKEHLRAIELEPGMSDAYNGLIFAYYKLKEYEQAWKRIETAKQLGINIPEDLVAAVKSNL